MFVGLNDYLLAFLFYPIHSAVFVIVVHPLSRMQVLNCQIDRE